MRSWASRCLACLQGTMAACVVPCFMRWTKLVTCAASIMIDQGPPSSSRLPVAAMRTTLV
jgi:hypothetical protein